MPTQVSFSSFELNSVAQQPMRAKVYCSYLSLRGLRCWGACADASVKWDERLSRPCPAQNLNPGLVVGKCDTTTTITQPLDFDRDSKLRGISANPLVLLHSATFVINQPPVSVATNYLVIKSA
ncbi:hypothetical protein TNCV_4424251 [Trichonephila clavipes]|nr:hypothetical protein TNCV_4424251 [Trichonephila clavipes]